MGSQDRKNGVRPLPPCTPVTLLNGRYIYEAHNVSYRKLPNNINMLRPVGAHKVWQARSSDGRVKVVVLSDSSGFDSNVRQFMHCAQTLAHVGD